MSCRALLDSAVVFNFSSVQFATFSSSSTLLSTLSSICSATLASSRHFANASVVACLVVTMSPLEAARKAHHRSLISGTLPCRQLLREKTLPYCRLALLVAQTLFIFNLLWENTIVLCTFDLSREGIAILFIPLMYYDRHQCIIYLRLVVINISLLCCEKTPLRCHKKTKSIVSLLKKELM